MSEQEPAVIEYTPHRSEVLWLSVAMNLRRPILWLPLAFVLLLPLNYFVSGGRFVSPLTPGREKQLLAAILTPIVIVSVIVFTFRRAVRRQWNNKPELSEPRTVQFDGEGIDVRGEHFMVKVEWVEIRSIDRFAGHVLIRTPVGYRVTLPMRAFRSPETWKRFEDLAKQRSLL